MNLIPGARNPSYIILLQAFMIFLGYRFKNMQSQQQAFASENEANAPPAVGETDFFKNIDNIYGLLQIETVEVEFGYSLIPLVDENKGSSFIDRLILFRKQFALDMGYVIPPVRLKDNGFLNPNQYIIKLKGEEIAKGEILTDYFLALDPGNLSGIIDGIDAVEPAYGIPCKWITPDKKELAEIYGYTVIDPLSVIVTHLSEVVKKHAHELLSRLDVNQLLDTVKKNNPALIEEVVPNIISHNSLKKILSNLLKESVPIRDMETILETIADYASSVKDTEMLTEHIRQALKRTITRKWSEGGQIKVITLDSEVERIILNAINKNGQETYLSWIRW
jgi:flagellar biosynthesis protein FlhA